MITPPFWPYPFSNLDYDMLIKLALNWACPVIVFIYKNSKGFSIEFLNLFIQSSENIFVF